MSPAAASPPAHAQKGRYTHLAGQAGSSLKADRSHASQPRSTTKDQDDGERKSKIPNNNVKNHRYEGSANS